MEIERYQELIQEDIKKDSDANKMFEAIDKMWNNDWDLPSGLKDRDYMRAFKTTAPHDAMLAAGRVMASKMPNISIQPMSPTSSDGLEERIESLLDWNLYNIIRRSPDNPLMDLAMSAVKYSRIAYQVICLPYELKGKNDPKSKAMKRLGNFAFRVHKNPQTVHARYDDMILESVSVASVKKANEVADLYPSARKKIESAILKELGSKEDLQLLMNRTNVSLYDWTDYENRAIWMSIGESALSDQASAPHVVILNEPHGMPFLPWVFKQDDHPLMKSVYDADLYANANVLESLRYYLVVATVAQARSWSRTLDGNVVEIDHSDPGSQVTMKQGEEFGMLPPAQLDPTINMLIESVRGDIRQTSVAEALTSIDRLASGTPFATVNAILQASISSLSSIQKLVESSIEEGLYQMLQWIDFANVPMLGLRRETKSYNKDTNIAGASLMLSKGEVNPEDIYIKVSMNTTTPTDKDAAINRAILVSTQLPVTPQKAMDDNGIEYSDADFQNWSSWQYFKAEQGADVARISMKPQLEAQQMMQQQQMQDQQAQMEAQANQEMNGETEVQQPGFDNTQGEAGLNPAQAQPGIGREQISNQDMSGAGIA